MKEPAHGSVRMAATVLYGQSAQFKAFRLQSVGCIDGGLGAKHIWRPSRLGLLFYCKIERKRWLCLSLGLSCKQVCKACLASSNLPSL